MDCSLPGSSVHGIFPGKNTGASCHFLLWGILPAQGWTPTSPALAGRFFTTEPPGKRKERCMYSSSFGSLSLEGSDSSFTSIRPELDLKFLPTCSCPPPPLHLSSCDPDKSLELSLHQALYFLKKPPLQVLCLHLHFPDCVLIFILEKLGMIRHRILLTLEWEEKKWKKHSVKGEMKGRSKAKRILGSQLGEA